MNCKTEYLFSFITMDIIPIVIPIVIPPEILSMIFGYTDQYYPLLLVCKHWYKLGHRLWMNQRQRRMLMHGLTEWFDTHLTIYKLDVTWSWVRYLIDIGDFSTHWSLMNKAAKVLRPSILGCSRIVASFSDPKLKRKIIKYNEHRVRSIYNDILGHASQGECKITTTIIPFDYDFRELTDDEVEEMEAYML